MNGTTPESGKPKLADAGAAVGAAGPAFRALASTLRAELPDRLVDLRLFGSLARGDWHEESDVDVAVVVRGLDAEIKRRLFRIIAEIELEHLTPLSTLVLSEERFAHLVARERRIALDILREGIAL